MLRGLATLVLAVVFACCGQGAASPSSATPTVAPTATLSSGPALGLGKFPPLPTGLLDSDRGTALQAILDKAVKDLEIPGIAAAIIVASEGTWVGASGTADGTAALDPAAQFGIGSVTKTIVAAQVLRLVESGAVDLDRPIADYLKAGTPANAATVRQVLGMRSGIPELAGDVRATCSDLAASFSIGDLRPALSADSIFEPGSQFRYTNANYLLAGLLIEDVTHSPIPEVLRAGVLSGTGLERLIYQDRERPSPPLAAPFVVLPGSDPVPSPVELLTLGAGYLPARCLASTAGPAGGMASDAMTLARWGYLLYGGWILGDAALAEMAHFESGYGLAAHDHAGQFGMPAIGHEGTVPGYVTQLLAFPDQGISIAVLVNTNGVGEESLTSLAGSLRAAVRP